MSTRLSTHASALTVNEWRARAVALFGDDPMEWKFVCPSCGHVAAVKDWKDAGATEAEIAFSCLGRHLPNPKRIGEKPGPCNYAGGGLFRLNPQEVISEDGSRTKVFDFAGGSSGSEPTQSTEARESTTRQQKETPDNSTRDGGTNE